MSSGLYGPGSGSAPLPHRRREPRKLNYDKCTFCRQAKVKCAPERRSWPTQKCSRCSEKMFPCSAPQRKGFATEGSKEVSRALSGPPPEQESMSPIGIKDALLLLSLHNILRLIIEEVSARAEAFVLLFKHDRAWRIHLRESNSIISYYDKILQTVSLHLIGLSKAESHAVISATLDITIPSSPVARAALNTKIDAIILSYEKADHHGVAYVLLMQQMMRQPSLFDSNKSRFLRYRGKFLDECLEFCEGLDTTHIDQGLHDLISRIRFDIPRTLLSVLPENPEAFLLQWNTSAGEDCLGRSMSRSTHDGIAPSHAYPGWHNLDFMHVACLRADYEMLEQVRPSPEMLKAECLGLRVLDIAAMKGDRRILKHIILNLGDRCSAGKQGGRTMRNCLHWAASCGHLEAVKDLCFWLSLSLNNIISAHDHLGDTPFHLAARFGHTKIVQRLLPLVNWDFINSSSQHSPFFSAVMGGHIAIMGILHAYSKIDNFQYVESSEDTSDLRDGRPDRLTPLAEAARQGFTAGVRYLLTCNEATPGTVNPSSINKYFDETVEGHIRRQTPLDFAIDGQHTECIVILKHYGAKTFAELDAAGNDDLE